MGLYPPLTSGIERAPDHARIGRLGVAQLPGLVDRLTGQAEVRDGGRCVPLRNGPLVALEAAAGHLAPVLCGIVLIRQPALSLRLDLEGVGLGAVGGRYQLIVRPLGLGEARRNLNFAVQLGRRKPQLCSQVGVAHLGLHYWLVDPDPRYPKGSSS